MLGRFGLRLKVHKSGGIAGRADLDSAHERAGHPSSSVRHRDRRMRRRVEFARPRRRATAGKGSRPDRASPRREMPQHQRGRRAALGAVGHLRHPALSGRPAGRFFRRHRRSRRHRRLPPETLRGAARHRPWPHRDLRRACQTARLDRLGGRPRRRRGDGEESDADRDPLPPRARRRRQARRLLGLRRHRHQAEAARARRRQAWGKDDKGQDAPPRLPGL